MLTESKQINNTASPIMLRIKQNFYNNKRLFFIITLLQLLGLPVLSVVTQISFYRNRADLNYEDNLRIYALMSVLAFTFAVGLGILISFRCFRYLYKKTETDMNLALPMKASQRFIGDFFSGLMMYVIPYIGACILSGISLFIGKSYYHSFLESISRHTSVLSCMTDGLLIMIMLYTLTSFITVCCGNSFECLIYTLIINIAVPLFLIVLSYIIFKGAFGIYYSNEAMESIIATSPIGGIIKILYYSNTMSYFVGNMYDIPFGSDDLSWNIVWILSFITVIVILFSGAFYLYKKRKAEDVSKPFVFSFIYYVFIIMMTIAIVGGMARIHAFIAGILISAFIFVVMSVIKNRGVNKMLKPCIFYVFSVVVSFSVVKLSDATDGFGQIYKIPDTSDIKSVSFIMSEDFFFSYSYPRYDKFTDKDDIQLIIDLQSDIINDYKAHNCVDYYNYESSYDDESFYNKYDCHTSKPLTKSLEIVYLMNNENMLYRTYTVPYSIWSEYMIKLAENRSYKEQKIKQFSNDIMYGLFRNGTTKYSTSLNISDPRYDISEGMDIPDETILKDLCKAYEKDIMEMTNQNIMNFSSFCQIYGYNIGTCFTNTVDVLKKNGLTVSTLNDYTKRLDYLNNGTFFIADSNYIIENNYTETDIITNDCGTPCQYIVNEYDYNSLLKLFNVAEPHYFTSEHCYVIKLGNQNYIIPPEYSKLAEEFMSQSKLEKVEIPYNDNQ